MHKNFFLFFFNHCKKNYKLLRKSIQFVRRWIIAFLLNLSLTECSFSAQSYSFTYIHTHACMNEYTNEYTHIQSWICMCDASRCIDMYKPYNLIFSTLLPYNLLMLHAGKVEMEGKLLIMNRLWNTFEHLGINREEQGNCNQVYFLFQFKLLLWGNC